MEFCADSDTLASGGGGVLEVCLGGCLDGFDGLSGACVHFQCDIDAVLVFFSFFFNPADPQGIT